jgi:hypothetical protein
MPDGLLIYAVAGDSRSGDVVTTQARLSLLATAAELYCHVLGRYPESLQELRSFSRSRNDPADCRYDDEFILDAWDRTIRYRLVDGVPVIESAGPDGVTGTSDDLSLPRPGEQLSDAIDVRLACSWRGP